MIPKTTQELDLVLSRMQKNGAPKDAMQRVVDAYKIQKTSVQQNAPLTASVLGIASSAQKGVVEEAHLEQVKQQAPTVGIVAEQISGVQEKQKEREALAIQSEMAPEDISQLESQGMTVEDIKGFIDKGFKKEDFERLTGLGFTGQEKILSTALTGIKEGGKELLQSAGEMGEAITGLKPTKTGQIEQLTPEERAVKLGSSLIGTSKGALETVFAAPSAVIAEVPVVGPGLQKGFELLNEKSLELSSTLKPILGIQEGTDQAKAFDEAMQLLPQLFLAKAGEAYGPKAIKEIKEKAPIVAEAVKATVIKPTAKMVKDVQTFVTEKLKTKSSPETVSKVSVELQAVIDQNKGLRNYADKQLKKGVDVKQNIANTDLLKGSVDKEGVIRTTQEGGSVSQYQEFLKPQEKVISQILESEGVKLPIKDVEAQLTEAIMKSGLQGKALTKALSEIKSEIEGYKLRADEGGDVSLSLLNDAKVNKYEGINYLSDTAQIDKVIAKSLKEIVEKNTKSADIKALNKELGQHYTNIEFLTKLDGMRVKGGKMGKYFAKTIGGIAGSTFGPLGAVAGAEIGGLIQGASMAKTFEKGTGKPLEMSPLMKESLKKPTP